MNPGDSESLGASVAADEPSRIRLQRPPKPQVEAPEVKRGSKPGQHVVRLLRPSERRFEPEHEGQLRATEVATAPRSRFEQISRAVRRVVVGTPLSTEVVEEQRLSKVKALAVFSSDALSSTAYATDEILIVLAIAGTAALSYSVPLALSIAVLLAIVTFSYKQTIKAYPNGGGAYIVARENLGEEAGLIAAASLAVDYVLTVSVSIAAGVLAIVSAFPELDPYRVDIAVGAVALVTLANLRGVKESGTIFAIPTYGFIVSFGVLIVAGFVRVLLDPDLTAPTPHGVLPAGSEPLALFLLLRAFASGCTALTGIEAISNGVPAFKKPESANAATTLTWMAIILTSLFLGITFLARQLEIQPSEDVSVAAQIGLTVFGEGPLFFLIQAFTALILILAANTAYAGLPSLAAILARDRFLPHQFTFRGDRLAFSNGIVVLGFAAAALIVFFGANVTRLIPLYAFGVFVSFTLSQSGMVKHWLRLQEPGFRKSIAINGVGAVATGIVAVIVGVTKFEHGAWISMVAMALLALLFWTIRRHFRRVEERLALDVVPLLSIRHSRRQPVIVPVEEINRATMRLIDYARSLSDNVTALHVTDDTEAGQLMQAEWESIVADVPLVVIASPYRSFVAPVLAYLDAAAGQDEGEVVTIVLAEYRTSYPWQRWLHNQSGRRLRHALRSRSDTAVVELPFDLGTPAGV